MRDSILITYIIPVYNGEKYLKECLKSIYQQTIDSFEIIIVNDGSEDGSLDIINEYITNDKRVILINNNHFGLSYSRNSALRLAHGKYIQFVDCDDYILPDMSEIMISTLESQNADLCICAMERVENQGNKLLKAGFDFITAYPMPFFDFFPLLWEYYLFQSSCNKIYKMNIIRDNRLSFNTAYNKLEDSLFNILYINYCRNIAYIDKTFYKYINRMNKSLTQVFHENEIDAILLFYDIISDIISGSGLCDDNVKNKIEVCKAKQLAEFLERIYNQPNSEKLMQEFQSKISGG